jgi:DNA-directed RNA polymerase specialized sigma24 family protein
VADAAQAEVDARLDELSRLLALQVRLTIGNQTQTILELRRLGFSLQRIADLLGTTSNTVNVAIRKANKRTRTAAPKGVERDASN